MKNVFTAGAALLLTTSIAQAGGLDRSGQSVGVLFEDGDVMQLSFGTASPDVSGVAVGAGLGDFESGDMSPSYITLGFGYKNELSDTLSIALIIDQPFGGDVDYPTDTNYFAQGGTAEVTSTAITGLLKYKVNDNASVYGGLRYQTIKSEVGIPAVGDYTLETESTSGIGFVLGAAYEIPDIALRVALTYSSEIDHEQDVTEFGALESTTEFNSPQSINLDFQSGVAEDTLVFGSIRWVEWSTFDFAPEQYAGATNSSLLSYDEDVVTYTLGVGRRFNDVFSGFASIGYEAQQGGFSGNLGPTDGFTSFGLGGTYQVQENIKVTGGIRYVLVGDAVVEHPAIADADGAEFEDNTAIGAGVQITYSF